MKKYLPDYLADSIYDIDYKRLYEMGIRGLCLDIDNTLVGMYDIIENVNSRQGKLLRQLEDMGFSLCILSNATKKRTSFIASNLAVEYVHLAFKPRTKGYNQAALLMGVSNSRCAMIGDQLFTDIKGGNKAGMLTIMTDKINTYESFNVKIKRIFENIFLKNYRKTIERI